MLLKPCLFDFSLSWAAARDHLLTGLIKKFIFVCFNCLSTDAARRDAEVKLLNTESSNGLAVNGRFVKWSSDGK